MCSCLEDGDIPKCRPALRRSSVIGASQATFLIRKPPHRRTPCDGLHQHTALQSCSEVDEDLLGEMERVENAPFGKAVNYGIIVIFGTFHTLHALVLIIL